MKSSKTAQAIIFSLSDCEKIKLADDKGKQMFIDFFEIINKKTIKFTFNSEVGCLRINDVWLESNGDGKHSCFLYVSEVNDFSKNFYRTEITLPGNIKHRIYDCDCATNFCFLVKSRSPIFLYKNKNGDYLFISKNFTIEMNTHKLIYF